MNHTFGSTGHPLAVDLVEGEPCIGVVSYGQSDTEGVEGLCQQYVGHDPYSGLGDPFHNQIQPSPPAPPPGVAMEATDRSHLLRGIGHKFPVVASHPDADTEVGSQSRHDGPSNTFSNTSLGLSSQSADVSPLLPLGRPQPESFVIWYPPTTHNALAGGPGLGVGVMHRSSTGSSSFASKNTAPTTVSRASSDFSSPPKLKRQTLHPPHEEENLSIAILFGEVIERLKMRQTPAEEVAMKRQRYRLQENLNCNQTTNGVCYPCHWRKQKCVWPPGSPLCEECIKSFQKDNRSWPHCLLARYRPPMGQIVLYRTRTDVNFHKPYKTLDRKPRYEEITRPIIQDLADFDHPMDICLTRIDKEYPNEPRFLKLIAVPFRKTTDPAPAGLEALYSHGFTLFERSQDDINIISQNVAAYVKSTARTREYMRHYLGNDEFSRSVFDRISIMTDGAIDTEDWTNGALRTHAGLLGTSTDYWTTARMINVSERIAEILLTMKHDTLKLETQVKKSLGINHEFAESVFDFWRTARVIELSRKVFDKALTIAMSDGTPDLANWKNETLRKDSGFLKAVLSYWTAARMIEGEWGIYNPRSIGLFPDSNGFADLTHAPMIDYGLSVYISGTLSNIRKAILVTLDYWFRKEFKEHFTAIFLGLYVMLHSFELLSKQQKDLALGLGKKTFTQPELIGDLIDSTALLVGAFRCKLNDKLSFSRPWKEQSLVFEKFCRNGKDGEDYRFFADIHDLVTQKFPPLIKLFEKRNSAGIQSLPTWEPLWFSAQLFTHEGTP